MRHSVQLGISTMGEGGSDLAVLDEACGVLSDDPATVVSLDITDTTSLLLCMLLRPLLLQALLLLSNMLHYYIDQHGYLRAMVGYGLLKHLILALVPGAQHSSG